MALTPHQAVSNKLKRIFAIPRALAALKKLPTKVRNKSTELFKSLFQFVALQMLKKLSVISPLKNAGGTSLNKNCKRSCSLSATDRNEPGFFFGKPTAYSRSTNQWNLIKAMCSAY